MEEDKMENDYKRNYFWIKRDLKGNRHYYFKIKGQDVYKRQRLNIRKNIFSRLFLSFITTFIIRCV